MDRIRAEKFEKLIALLQEADALQQELLGDVDESECYEIHDQLDYIMSRIECWAENQEQETV